MATKKYKITENNNLWQHRNKLQKVDAANKVAEGRKSVSS